MKTFDCSIFGSKTFEISKDAILKNLTEENLRVVLTRNPNKFSTYAQKDVLEFTNDDLAEILRELKQRKKKRCAILGGARVYTEFIKRGLMQELWLTLEPLAFGTGKRIFGDQVDFRFSLENVEYLSKNTLLLKYRIKQS